MLFPHSTILRNGDFSPGNVALLASNYFESRPQGAMRIVDPVVRRRITNTKDAKQLPKNKKTNGNLRDLEEEDVTTLLLFCYER